LTNGRPVLSTLKDGLIECEALKTITTVADKGSLAGVRAAVASSRNGDERRCKKITLFCSFNFINTACPPKNRGRGLMFANLQYVFFSPQ